MTVIVCVSEVARKLLSPLRVASTVHVMPPRAAVKVVPDNVHEPEVTAHETEPVPWPPVAVNV